MIATKTKIARSAVQPGRVSHEMSILNNQVSNLIVQTLAGLPGVSTRVETLRVAVVQQAGYPSVTFYQCLYDLISNGDLILLESDHLPQRVALNPNA
jgi:hypothetical protein